MDSALPSYDDENELSVEEILTIAHVAARIDVFISESIGSMRARAFTVAGAHLLNGVKRRELEITTLTDDDLPAYASAQALDMDDDAVTDGINAMNRLIIIATWTALETLVDDLHAVIQPDAPTRNRTKKAVRKRLEEQKDWQRGVTMFEAWFTAEGIPSVLDPDHETLLRHVARLRNAVTHDGLYPSARYLAHAPADWGLTEWDQLLIPEPSIEAALEGIALYVAYLGTRLTGTPSDLVTESPDILLTRYLHPHTTPPRPRTQQR